MAKTTKEQKTTVTKRKDARYPGETLLEVSFGAGTSSYQGCMISVLVDVNGRPTIDVYRVDENIRVLVPGANLVESAESQAK